jgi:putative membrane protein
MQRSVFTGILALAVAAGASARAAVLPPADATFVQTAERDALGDYALASLAERKAQSPRVRALAASILSDSGRAVRFIETYAKAHGVRLDAKPTTRADAQYGEMRGAGGRDFDREFVEAIETDASFDTGAYRREAAGGSDPALRSFAGRELSFLRQIAAAAGKILQ